MTGSAALEVAIGLVVTYTLLSLVCSTTNEWISRYLGLRATSLRQGVNELLADGVESGLAAEFHRHPLIQALKPTKAPVLRRSSPGSVVASQYPSYIPAETFALVIMDLTMTVQGPQAGNIASATLNRTIRATTTVVPPFLGSVIADVHGDADAVRQRLESWFNQAMDRVSGWYKRRTQVNLLIMGALIAVALNVDTIRIAAQLFNSPTLRAAVGAEAQRLAGPPNLGASPPTDSSAAVAKYLADLDALGQAGLPIGWDATCNPVIAIRGGAARTCHASAASALGLLLTVVALSLGAPFWFETLNRLVNLRQTGKPPVASPRS